MTGMLGDKIANIVNPQWNPRDPYMPNWEHAPKYAQYHTIDPDGMGTWWTSEGIILGTDGWYVDSETLTRYQSDTASPYDMTGLDWRNSLRARPEVQP